MKRFRNFPIWINYNVFTDREREAALRDRLKRFYASKEGAAYIKEQDEWRKQHGREPFDHHQYMEEEDVKTGWEKRRDEIKWERQTRESIAYEDKITALLEKICQTPPGKLLFNSMLATERIWILFHEGLSKGVAATTPGAMSEKMGGGVRLYFDPDGFDTTMEYYTPDDVLFHELIHAYRAAKGKHNYRAMKEYETAEEFLAIHIQNVYMAYMGRRKYYFSHSNSGLATRDKIYNAISSENETLFTLRHYLQDEPYAKAIAQLKEPDFNCWRDLGHLDAVL